MEEITERTQNTTGSFLELHGRLIFSTDRNRIVGRSEIRRSSRLVAPVRRWAESDFPPHCYFSSKIDTLWETIEGEARLKINKSFFCCNFSLVFTRQREECASAQFNTDKLSYKSSSYFPAPLLAWMNCYTFTEKKESRREENWIPVCFRTFGGRHRCIRPLTGRMESVHSAATGTIRWTSDNQSNVK